MKGFIGLLTKLPDTPLNVRNCDFDYKTHNFRIKKCSKDLVDNGFRPINTIITFIVDCRDINFENK